MEGWKLFVPGAWFLVCCSGAHDTTSDSCGTSLTRLKFFNARTQSCEDAMKKGDWLLCGGDCMTQPLGEFLVPGSWRSAELHDTTGEAVGNGRNRNAQGL
eukprot:TRINITY_DN26204_c0_g1_i4.p5 TRINITY_DN26204_c0_g1~~TRINITY_DN26204_c0_g1_i4.p5  ORF type:complete len:100 (+),score=2.28 TRINITY_DN26204_c0_g1_i4:576-875(+)